MSSEKSKEEAAKAAKAAEKAAKADTPMTDEEKLEQRKKVLKDGGFHNCAMYRLEKKNNQIVKFGQKVKDIKAMHESNIDEYNTQQVNTGLFIKKDGYKYELTDCKVGNSKVLKMFVEVNK
jgi:hypothetical protein